MTDPTHPGPVRPGGPPPPPVPLPPGSPPRLGQPWPEPTPEPGQPRPQPYPLPKPLTPADFLARVGPSSCWPWMGAKKESGYGIVEIDGRVYRAHRVAYELFVGPIPDGMTVDHLCHNQDETCEGGPTCAHRACVNPAHLDVASALENARRAYRPRGGRARSVREAGFCPCGHSLTDSDALTPAGRCRQCSREYQQRPAVRIRRNQRKRLDRAQARASGA